MFEVRFPLVPCPAFLRAHSIFARRTSTTPATVGCTASSSVRPFFPLSPSPNRTQLQNRAFQGQTSGTSGALNSWSSVGSGSSISVVGPSTVSPVSSALPNSLLLSVPSSASGAVGFANSGFWGIKVSPAAYTASFFARRTAGSFGGPLTVSLASANGGTVFASANVTGLSADWKQFSVTLAPTSAAGDGNNVFRVTVDGGSARGSSVAFALLSLFPPTFKNRPNGMRADIAQALADAKPSFWRFPGGNNVEGQTIPQFWNWTATVGSLVNRPGRQGDWGYFNTDGLGLLEYLQWCEDLDMVGIMAVYAGYSLNGQSVPQAQLQQYVDLAVNQVQFAIGDPAKNSWAALRAQLGHPAPFNVQYIEIGNEDNLNSAPGTYTSYRWAAFANAISAAFPNIGIIATTTYQTALNPPAKFVDAHVYQTPTWFAGQNEAYKSRSSFPLSGAHMSAVVRSFEGEYAVTSTNSSCLFGSVSCGRLAFPTLRGSIGEAVFMAGLERDSDLVFAASYAPLLQHINSTQWTPDLMFSVNRGDRILSVDFTTPKNPLFWVASQNTKTKQVFVKLVNNGASTQSVQLIFPDLAIQSVGTATTLAHTNFDIANTPAAPNSISPTTKAISASTNFSYSVPGQAFVVLALSYA
ncbi:glycoside hydrolase [Auricularia subglabra TFB-10046 SS5]|nr:glycoside hydrolase [Auricularia subglabra TFB-10046 SS5]